MSERFEEIIRSKTFLVAEVDNAIVGHGFIDKQTGEIESLFVDPTYQRRHIGIHLLFELENIARKDGTTVLRLSATLNSVFL